MWELELLGPAASILTSVDTSLDQMRQKRLMQEHHNRCGGDKNPDTKKDRGDENDHLLDSVRG